MKPRTNGTAGPPSVNVNGPGFPAKSITMYNYLAVALRRKTLKRTNIHTTFIQDAGIYIN